MRRNDIKGTETNYTCTWIAGRRINNQRRGEEDIMWSNWIDTTITELTRKSNNTLTKPKLNVSIIVSAQLLTPIRPITWLTSWAPLISVGGLTLPGDDWHLSWSRAVDKSIPWGRPQWMTRRRSGSTMLTGRQVMNNTQINRSHTQGWRVKLTWWMLVLTAYFG